MTSTTKARKGDLILVEDVSVNYYSLAARDEARAAGLTLSDVITTYHFGVVDSATREGQVKTWRGIGWGDELISSGYPRRIGYARRWVMTVAMIDVDAVLRAAKAHHWPGHPDQPRAFDTLAEAKAFARPFVHCGRIS